MSEKPENQSALDDITPETAEAYARLKHGRKRLQNINVRLQLLNFAGIKDSSIALVVDEICNEINAFEHALSRFLHTNSDSISDRELKSAAADEFKDLPEQVRNSLLLNAKGNAG